MLELTSAILFALLLTQVIEVAVARLMGCVTKDDLTCIVLVNLVTHPPFSCCFIFGSRYLDGRQAVLAWLLTLEIIVTLLEWRLLKASLSPAKAPTAGKLALMMNLVSGGIGFLRQ